MFCVFKSNWSDTSWAQVAHTSFQKGTAPNRPCVSTDSTSGDAAGVISNHFLTWPAPTAEYLFRLSSRVHTPLGSPQNLAVNYYIRTVGEKKTQPQHLCGLTVWVTLRECIQWSQHRWSKASGIHNNTVKLCPENQNNELPKLWRSKRTEEKFDDTSRLKQL